MTALTDKLKWHFQGHMTVLSLLTSSLPFDMLMSTNLPDKYFVGIDNYRSLEFLQIGETINLSSLK